MRIVYMGTPDFAVPPLAALVENGYEIVAVVTQPDKPKGRGKTLLPPPVKEEAMKHDIPIYQPLKVRDPEFVETLSKLEHSKNDTGYAKVWMSEYTCVTFAEIQRRSANSAGCDRWRKRIRSNTHENGRRTGYRRYDRAGSCTAC